ncbi:MAG: ParA family protein [Dehalococcoidia bacterium]|nr:ParA family protein [Dehalococcoidia bacterium]
MIVDLGPRAGVEMSDALRLADVAIIPVRPCAFDMYTMRLVDDLARDARGQNPELRALALINQASTKHMSQEAGQARDVILAGCSVIGVAESVVGYRVAFQRASLDGRTVPEFAKPSDRGVREMKDLYREVFGKTYAQTSMERVA